MAMGSGTRYDSIVKMRLASGCDAEGRPLNQPQTVVVQVPAGSTVTVKVDK